MVAEVPLRVLALIAPTVGRHPAWLEARREWGAGQHEDGFGLNETDDVETSEGFAIWVDRLLKQSDPTLSIAAGVARCTYLWIVEGDEVLGGIALRHDYTALVARVGHVGFGVRPSARGRGVATWALGRILDEARTSGLDRVLIVCETDNLASVRVIERLGGVLDLQTAAGQTRVLKYWIDLGSARRTG
jgi:predicted acetyltransferase